MPKLYILGCLLLAAVAAQAQSGAPGVRGARAAALGNASVTLGGDLWAVGNNVAGLAQLTRPEVGVYAENRFLIPNLNNAALAAALPLGRQPEGSTATTAPHGVAGLELQRFGDKRYSESRAGLGYAYRLGLISVGARLDMLQLSIEGLGSRRTVAASLGGQADVVPQKLTFGVYLYNLNQAKLAEYQDERVPTVLRAGLGFRPTTKVLLVAETEKDIDRDADFRAGVEYQVVDALTVRAGIATLTEQVSAGFGLRFGQLRVDYGAQLHNVLGLSQHLNVNFRLGPKP
ncbi:hypothetical protein F0P96_12180 [Hymenobacter busanensis]|uniref:Uncharacterized protein n=1 Tax=Hymenobacter busanensis TaxID=2607656 RepID=A0A7L4ZVD4_9BACT|nr:hypothetical protein [Hymenobacter busanensis]KAA9332233.1 hypothetical protein F0P96_12180 [Hymenobacter busanensis]QHJ07429.1 hypothetical protein GUY19_09090 [Hymenobacter busanensis]